MACRNKYLSSSIPKLCIGSMNSRISIQKRTVTYKGIQSVYSFTTLYTVWADVETRSGVDKFSGIVMENAITHIFKIRSLEGLTSELWIDWKSNRYKIETIETKNEGQYMLLYCQQTGDDSKDGAKS